MSGNDADYGFCESNDYARAFASFEQPIGSSPRQAARSAIAALMGSRSVRPAQASTVVVLTQKDMLSLAQGGPPHAQNTCGPAEVPQNPAFATYVLKPAKRRVHFELPQPDEVNVAASAEELRRLLRSHTRIIIFDQSSLEVEALKQPSATGSRLKLLLSKAQTLKAQLADIGETNVSSFFELTIGLMDCVWPRSDTHSIAHGAMRIAVEAINHVEKFREQRKLFSDS